ncbi:pyridoxamine 5'-phosphate oxidase [Rhodococcus sp. NPDC047139]|uniref:pyridoxamine 5'-phosphate oxidase n=1 Tax=Rhodococcus sp. NPDC047139 TaxID=3155141 RepID=UPI0033CAED2E
MRVDYTPAGPAGESPADRDLTPDDVAAGWLPLLHTWFASAVAAGVPEPNAMVLATVDTHGHPATRTVLCKKLDADGLAFFTNFESDKGRHLAALPYASATLLWLPMYRQVTVRGPVVRVPDEETLAYWRTRPRGSRLGAWASQQSRPVKDRFDLEHALVEVAEQYALDDDIPVPPFWGGFRIVPETVEFWQGRPNRLHNRVRTRSVDGRWITERLQP